MTERLALHDVHVSEGAQIESVAGRERPRSYGDPAGEYAAVRGGVGLIDRGDTGVLEVTGRDRAVFLHAMLSNDVKSLAPGQGCAAALLDIHGKVQVIVVVLALPASLLVLTPVGRAAATNEALDRYLFSEKAYFKDVTGDHSLLLLAGAGAPGLVERLFGTSVGEAPWSHVEASADGIEVRLVRGRGETGAPEVWLVGGAGDGPALWRMARAAGARPVGFAAQESLRVEAGVPLYPDDADEAVLLPELPVDDLVSYTKGCYIGQEVVVRIRDRGHVNRHLRGLVLEGQTVPPPRAPVMVGEAEVGHVTSTAWSFGLERPVALAFVRRQHAEPGTAVTVRVGESVVAATVSALPIAPPTTGA